MLTGPIAGLFGCLAPRLAAKREFILLVLFMVVKSAISSAHSLKLPDVLIGFLISR